MENLSSDLVYVGVNLLFPYSVQLRIPYMYGFPIGFDQKTGKHYIFPLPEENKPIKRVELTPEKVLELGFKFEERLASEYTGPKEWESLFTGSIPPYTFEHLIARADSWTDEWLWVKDAVPYIP